MTAWGSWGRLFGMIGVEQVYVENIWRLERELMAESFVHYADKLVTRDYLDARLDGQWEKIDSRFAQMQAEFDGRFAQMRSDIDMRFAAVHSKFTQLFWMMGIGFTVLVIPQLQAWFS
jgi:hypothetical protein